jgi:hypothetical protein
MKKVKVINYKNNLTYGTESSNPEEWINDCIKNNYWGKPERWILQNSELYEESDVLEIEEKINEITEEVTIWIKLKAEYTIEIEDITEQLNKENRVKELKKLLSESDFRMTTDYFKRMSLEDQTYWDETRESWRQELRSLGV